MKEKIIDDLSFKLLVSNINLNTKLLKETNLLLLQLSEENKILHNRVSKLENRVLH